MERRPFAAMVRDALNKTAHDMRASQPVRDGNANQDGAAQTVHTSRVTRRRVLQSLTALGVAGVLDGSLTACFASGETTESLKGRYPEPQPVVGSSAAISPAEKETTTPSAEKTFSETELERCIREQAKRLAQLTLDTYTDPPYAAFPERVDYGDNAGTYTVPLNSGWERGKKSSEYRFYVLETTVNETTPSNGDTQPVIGNSPLQASIGRQRGTQTPEEVLDDYTLTHVGEGNWCLTSTRRVTANKKTHEETINYYTKPGEGQNAFDENALCDLQTIDELTNAAETLKNTPKNTPYHKLKPFPVPTFIPRQ